MSDQELAKVLKEAAEVYQIGTVARLLAMAADRIEELARLLGGRSDTDGRG